MKKKIFLTILLVFVVSLFTVNAYAGSFFNNIINQGTSFQGNSNTGIGKVIPEFIKTNIMPIISLVGNLIFAAVTVILGAKYIWSSADGKSQVMESLPSFVAAVLFFYLGEEIVKWFTDASSSIVVAREWNTIAGKVLGTINLIVSLCAFGGLLFLGLKYMFASAEGKSQIKTNMGGLILGIIFVFMASRVVDFIIDIGEEII